MTNAAITPGTQPHNQSKKTIAIDPHPLPITESGGKNMASKTLQILINKNLGLIDVCYTSQTYRYCYNH